MDGKRTPLDGRQLRRYIASMREVVDFYKSLGFKPLNDCSNCSLNHGNHRDRFLIEFSIAIKNLSL